MVLELLRFAAVIAVLVAIHRALDWYLRHDTARRLREEHARGEGGALTREDYVARGLARYRRSWERKLLYAIYVVPFLVMAVVLLLVQFGWTR